MVGDGNHFGGIETIVDGNLILAYALGSLRKLFFSFLGLTVFPPVFFLSFFSFFSFFALSFFSFSFLLSACRTCAASSYDVFGVILGISEFQGMIFRIQYWRDNICTVFETIYLHGTGIIRHDTIIAIGIHHQALAKTRLAYGTANDVKIYILIPSPEILRSSVTPGFSRLYYIA